MIFTPWNTGLGDQVATMNLLAARGKHSAEVCRLSFMQHGHSMERLHRELYDVFETMNVMASARPGDTPLSGFDVWAADPWPTKEQWRSRASHPYYVAQFDGISSPEKNPPPGDVIAIGRALKLDYGLSGFQLGHDQSIDECVRLMANAAFFVGSCSGMGFLALSVGVPVFILEYGLPIVTTFRNKRHIPCAGAQDFIDHKLPTWSNYRKFIGPGL